MIPFILLNCENLCLQEYENQSTAEAKFVKDLDKFDMILQVKLSLLTRPLIMLMGLVDYM